MSNNIPRRIKVKINTTYCPYCNNDNVFLIVDFVKKREGVNNVGFCVKKVYRTPWGITKIKGCGREFKLRFAEKKFPIIGNI